MKALTPARPPGVSAACDALPPAWGDATHRLRGNMSGCYSRLRRLVPTIPPDRRLSRVEILQHVIDYILELQSALETHRAMLRRRRGTPATPRTPLTALNLGQVSLCTGVTVSGCIHSPEAGRGSFMYPKRGRMVP
nr:DNA-binding protein inhibitor ID-4-like isoform X1 [Paramormyrops kingsleyae]